MKRDPRQTDAIATWLTKEWSAGRLKQGYEAVRTLRLRFRLTSMEAETIMATANARAPEPRNERTTRRKVAAG